MTSIRKIVKGDDEVYENTTSSTIDGGVLVAASGTVGNSGRPGIQVAGDGAGNVVGITATVSVPAGNFAADSEGTTLWGGNYSTFDTSVPQGTVTCYSHGIFPATYTAAAVTYGDKVCAAANGQVRKWVSGTDKPESIIGFCAEPNGVSAAGGSARVKLAL